ncbi:MAG: TonB-dependent receptor, partial [Dokdonia donghaensis]|nr:TonB-dependent receptor [Dokdonia donghaensis]
MMRHLLVVFSFFAIATTYAQTNNTEILIVSEDNIPLEDVIAYKSSNVIATSNDKGILSFKNPSTEEFILRLTLKDFKPVSLKISPNTFKYTVVLSKAEEELNTVILASTYQKESKVLIPTT